MSPFTQDPIATGETFTYEFVPQLVFAKDGIPLDQPYGRTRSTWRPGERYSVLLQAETPGTWVFHCHILTHVERADGMFGMVTAIVVNPKE